MRVPMDILPAGLFIHLEQQREERAMEALKYFEISFYMCTHRADNNRFSHRDRRFFDSGRSKCGVCHAGYKNHHICKICFNQEFFSRLYKIVFFQIFAMILHLLNKKRGLRTSGLLYLFWFILLIFSIPQYRTEIAKNSDEASYSFISYMIYFPLVLFIFLLNCFADTEPLESPYPKKKVYFNN